MREPSIWPADEDESYEAIEETFRNLAHCAAAGGGAIEGANIKSCGEQALGAIAGAPRKNV